MQDSRKKFWTVFSVVCISIIVLCVAFSLVFKLRKVDVELRSRNEIATRLPDNIKEEVKTSGDFAYGKNVLFMNFDDNINKIEKEIPFIKVEQVITYFPNIARVYISERVPKYRIQDKLEDTLWYILDVDFKVLDTYNTTSADIYNYLSTTTEISPSCMKLSTSIGAFVTDDEIKQYLSNILDGVYGRTKNTAVLKSIEIIENNGDYNFNLVMRNAGVVNEDGCRIQILGVNDLTEKVFSGVSYFEDNIKATSKDKYENIITVSLHKVDGYYEAVFVDNTQDSN